MKEVIYTIPINDAYDVKCGCPVCRLENKLNEESLEYVMGAAMMEPDVRIETNRLGFCDSHFRKMLQMKNRLSLGLMLQSYLRELLELGLPSDCEGVGKREMAGVCEKLGTSSDNCYVCARAEEKLGIYIRNIVYIWADNEEFREKTRVQEYFCPRHLAKLVSEAQKVLPKKRYSEFLSDHFLKTREIIRGLEADVTKFCNSYNYKFRDVPLREAKNSPERTIAFLKGDTE